MGKQLFVANLGENVEEAQKAFDRLKEVYPETDYNVQLYAETTVKLDLEKTEEWYTALQKYCESMSRPAAKRAKEQLEP